MTGCFPIAAPQNQPGSEWRAGGDSVDKDHILAGRKRLIANIKFKGNVDANGLRISRLTHQDAKRDNDQQSNYAPWSIHLPSLTLVMTSPLFLNSSANHGDY